MIYDDEAFDRVHQQVETARNDLTVHQRVDRPFPHDPGTRETRAKELIKTIRGRYEVGGCEFGNSPAVQQPCGAFEADRTMVF